MFDQEHVKVWEMKTTVAALVIIGLHTRGPFAVAALRYVCDLSFDRFDATFINANTILWILIFY